MYNGIKEFLHRLWALVLLVSTSLLMHRQSGLIVHSAIICRRAYECQMCVSMASWLSDSARSTREQNVVTAKMHPKTLLLPHLQKSSNEKLRLLVPGR